MNRRYLFALCLSGIILLSGCGDSVVSCPPAADTTLVGTTTTTTPSTSTTQPPETTTTTTPTVVSAPSARELLGQTYGDFLHYTDNDCRLIHARFHTDVAFGLESDRLPHYELAEADNALKDWNAAIALEKGTTLSPGDIHLDRTITAVYVKEGGFVTKSLKVGDKVSDWQAILPDMPALTIVYDFARGFNNGFYGLVSTTIEGVNARVYVDLTTDQAVQALAKEGITLGATSDPATDPYLGKTVSLPDLPIGGARIWLKDQG